MTGHVVQDCGPHGIPSYTDDAGTVHVATGGRCAGPAVPIPPDAARDARRAAYAARERERATAALDRYMSEKYPRLSMTASQMMDVFGAFRAGYAASEEHHKSHYGVSTQPEPDRSVNFYRCLGCSFVTASADSVVEHVNATGHMIEGNG